MNKCTAALLIVAVLTGCSETMLIKSYPPNAKAYVDGQYIGTTPAFHTVPRAEVSDNHRYRVEYGNCDPAEGQITTGVAGGRIVGYIFTVGLLSLVRGPHYFRPVDVALQGGDCGAGRVPVAAPARLGGVTGGVNILQIVGDKNLGSGAEGADGAPVQELATRLSVLRDLYNRKLITEQEYERERQRALGEFGRK